jgi:putative transposase
MGSVGDAYDNAMCESFFATLECELLARRRFTSQAEARMAVFSYIEGWYNPARRHSGIGYLSPIAYETQMLNEPETTSKRQTVHRTGSTPVGTTRRGFARSL